MLIIKQHRIYRQDLIANRQILYVFGDNLERVGLGGQAKEMRSEPNAHGIATKRKAAHGHDNCYFHDSEADAMEAVIKDFSHLRRRFKIGQYRALIWPGDGIGTGLAELNTRAPLLLDFINSQMEQLQ